MAPRQNPAHLGPGLTAREAAQDAVTRFLQGLDFADEAMLRSSLTADAVLDLRGSPVGGERAGADEIVRSAQTGVFRLVTGHHASNVRVRLADAPGRAGAALVTAYAIAQHFPPGEAHGASDRRRCVMGNYYAVDVVRDGDDDEALWRIKRFELTTLWSEGDFGVFEV